MSTSRADAERPPTRLLVGVLVAMLLAPLLALSMPLSPLRAAANPDLSIERLAGADRYATAAAISQRFFAPGVPVVVVATGEDYPDGLAAGPAAHSLGGPVLFVRRAAIPTATLTELQRLEPGRLVVVGGPAVVSDAVLGQLAALAPGGAVRVAGPDRYATAAAIARAAFATASVVHIATGATFPDGLVGGAAAAQADGPILLTGAASLPQATRDELARLGPTRIVLLGGVGAVSDEVEVALGEYAPDVVRVAGPDRYTTAAAISAAALDAGAGSAFLATGLTFPDALAAVPAAASQAAPILLAAGGLPAAVQAELDRLDPDRVFLLGGGAALPIRVAKEAQRTLGICWAANKPAAGAQQVLTRIAGAEGQVALTFDMGGRLSPAVDIVRYLIDDQICATIFPTGSSAQTAIGRQVMALIAAHPELLEVGNHTLHHCNLRDGGGGAACPASPDAAFIRSELKAAATVISGLTGQSPAPYWRPPYGASDATVRSVAASVGYTTTVMWHVDTIDWDPDTTADLIVSRVLAKVTDGSIVLLHLGGYHTLDALPTLVDELRGRGYGLTTISDLLDR